MARSNPANPSPPQPPLIAPMLRELHDWLRRPYRKLLENMRFGLFLAGLAIVGIWFSHHTERMVRQTERLEREVQDLKYAHTTLSAQLSHVRRQSNLREQVDTLLGLKPIQAPPYVLRIQANDPN